MRHASGHLLLFSVSLVWLAVEDSRASADPRPVKEMSLHEGADSPARPNCVWLGFSPDSNWLAARHKLSDAQMRIRLWSTKDWKAHGWNFDSFCDESVTVHKCAFAPDS